MGLMNEDERGNRSPDSGRAFCATVAEVQH